MAHHSLQRDGCSGSGHEESASLCSAGARIALKVTLSTRRQCCGVASRYRDSGAPLAVSVDERNGGHSYTAIGALSRTRSPLEVKNHGVRTVANWRQNRNPQRSSMASPLTSLRRSPTSAMQREDSTRTVTLSRKPDLHLACLDSVQDGKAKSGRRTIASHGHSSRLPVERRNRRQGAGIG